jgi:hypothetical protein
VHPKFKLRVASTNVALSGLRHADADFGVAVAERPSPPARIAAASVRPAAKLRRAIVVFLDFIDNLFP